MELAAAARTGCGEVWTRRDLEALAAVKAGVGNQILRAWHAIDLQRRLTLELSGGEAVRLERNVRPAREPPVLR